VLLIVGIFVVNNWVTVLCVIYSCSVVLMVFLLLVMFIIATDSVLATWCCWTKHWKSMKHFSSSVAST